MIYRGSRGSRLIGSSSGRSLADSMPYGLGGKVRVGGGVGSSLKRSEEELKPWNSDTRLGIMVRFEISASLEGPARTTLRKKVAMLLVYEWTDVDDGLMKTISARGRNDRNRRLFGWLQVERKQIDRYSSSCPSSALTNVNAAMVLLRGRGDGTGQVQKRACGKITLRASQPF